MCEIINNIEGMPGRNCLYASITSLMQYYGYSLGEAELFFLCSGLEYQYITSRHEKVQSPGQKFIYRNIKEIGTYLVNFINMNYFYGDSLTADKDFEYICQSIYDRNPVVIMLYPSILKYTPRDFQPEGESELHCIILYGIDIKKRKAYIIDSYVVDNSGRVSYYKGEIALDIIREEVKGYLFFNVYEIKQINSKVIKKSVCDALQLFLLAEEINDNLSGWRALLKGIENIWLLSIAEEGDAADFCLELSYLLRAHFLFVFDYLLDILKKYGFIDNDMSVLEESLSKCRHEWSRYCIKIWKTSFKVGSFDLKKLTNEGSMMIDNMKPIFREIIQYLQKDKRAPQ